MAKGRNKLKDRGSLQEPRSGLRIAVDLPWDATAHMGTGAYSETMVRALAIAAPNCRIMLVAPHGATRNIALDNASYHSAGAVDVGRDGYRQVALPALLEKLQPDCLFAPATLLPMVKVCPMVMTVHDLTFVEHPEYYSQGLVDHLNLTFEPSLRAADHIVTVSEESKSCLIRHFHIAEEKVTVVHQPVREVFLEQLDDNTADAFLAEMGVNRPFFFHLSNLAPHKNAIFAIEAFAKFLRDQPEAKHLLVFAGGGIAPNKPPDILQHARLHGVADRIKYVGRVDDEQLKALYQCCSAFLFPSLAEGWGLPVAEANALQARVLASTYVPAAGPDQRLPLDLDTWAHAMADSSGIKPGTLATSLLEAGRKLLDVLMLTIDTKGGQQSGQPVVVTVDRQAQRKTQMEVHKRPDEIKIGFRADWYSPSGFGEAARSIFEALESTRLAPCPISVPKDTIQVSELWPTGCHAGIEKADVWIHCLPPDWHDLNPPGKHVALFFWETDRLITDNSRGPKWNWVGALNELNEIWVPSGFVKTALRNSDVKTATEIIPLPVDTERYSPGPRRSPPCDLPNGFDPTWTVFLYVGSWDERKRPDILVRAFCRAFQHSDNALLILKSYLTGDPVKDSGVLQSWLAKCKSGTAHVRLIHEVVRPQDMLNLYRLATVFATASRGEGFCLPAVQSMSCGSPVVAHGWSAFEDYVSVPVGFQLANLPSNIGFPAYTSEQRWAEVDEEDLAAKLLWVHRNRAQVARLGREARDWVLRNACMKMIGRQLRRRLLELTSN